MDRAERKGEWGDGVKRLEDIALAGDSGAAEGWIEEMFLDDGQVISSAAGRRLLSKRDAG